MRKILYYLAAFIIFCFLGNTAIHYAIARQIDERSPYCLSFASIGANFLESRLDCWAKISLTNTFAEMDQELIDILTLLSLPVNKEEFQHQEYEGKKILRYKIVCNQQYYLFTLQNESEATYFLLTCISNQDDKLQHRTEQLLKQTLPCKSYWRYKGVIPARLDEAGRQSYANIIIKSLKGRQVDCYEDASLISVTGYSANLQNEYASAQVAGKTYNLQAALHSDAADNQTFVYLGFPLLLNEY